MNSSKDIFGFYGAALKLHAQRAEVLANNITNADTPNFKARDVDFRQALDKAIDSLPQDVTPQATHTNHIQPVGGEASNSLKDLSYRVPLQPSLDGNTVELHVEQAQFAENALRYQAALNFLDDRIRSLKSAMSRE